MTGVAAVFCACAAVPQAPSKAVQGSKDAATHKPEIVQVSGENIIQNESTGEGSARNIEIVDDQTVIHADDGRWNTKQRVARMTGNLSLKDPQADGTADTAQVFYARSKRLVVLTGRVQITIKPRKEQKEAPAPAQVSIRNGKAEVPQTPDEEDKDSPRKYPAVVTCDRAEYHYDRNVKYALLTGHFKVTQALPDKVRTLTADHAEWWGKEERVLLHGPVHIEDTKGMNGDTAGDVTLYTTEGDERIIMRKGTIRMPVEDTDEGEGKPPVPSPAVPGGAKLGQSSRSRKP
ncbi:MAG: hypothetical protein ACP5VE_04540 [Chthonomonadales bacterium]